jgi:exonuclease 3'-5' domain-containing protein 1
MEITTICTNLHPEQRCLRQAFSTSGRKNGTTLRSILQSETIPKLFWDMRNDSAGLFHRFKIQVAGIIDVQSLHLATICQRWPKQTRDGLDSVIRGEKNLMSEERKLAWIRNKNVGKGLWCPELGGDFSAFTVRPLLRPIILCCVGDVEYLQQLYSRFWPKYFERVEGEGQAHHKDGHRAKLGGEASQQRASYRMGVMLLTLD